MLSYVEACEHGLWHLVLYPDGKAGKPKPVPFRCHSWRHEGECRQWKGAQDFARIKEALSGETSWLYLVLTFDQRQWSSSWEQYKCGGLCWGVLLKRFKRRYGCTKYVQTWERFRKGGAHVNVCVYNQEALEQVAEDWRRWRNDWLTPNAVAAGFGQRTWVQLIEHGSTKLAGYLAKMAREMTGKGKSYQIPIDAPAHFRRLRASRDTLPPAATSDIEGRLVMSPLPTER